MFIRKTIFKTNLMAILLVSVYSTANAATIYGCQDKNGKMSFSNSACSSNYKELFKKSIPGSDKAANTVKPPAQNNTTTPVITPSQATATLPPVPSVLPKSDIFFAKNSFWYTPLPVNAPLAINSALLTQELIRQKTTYYGTIGLNVSTSYSSPVYYVDASVPKVKVTPLDCSKKGYTDYSLGKQWEAVPMPNYARQADGTDAEMTVYQASTDTIWEFWKAKKDANGKWGACWGGRMQNASLSDGVFPTYYGTTATSLPFLGGQITAEELARGEIKHVIGIALVDTANWNVVSWPAHRSDGVNPKGLPDRIAEGQRFRLDPSINVDTLKMGKAGKVIAKAAQKYGFVVWDRAGAVVLRAQNPLSYTTQGLADPYPSVLEGKKSWDVLTGFPWDKLQFLPISYGKS
ncbi:DUF4124 domain-containing protein [Methylotenera sp.]|uniref:DUF4124 domain-containing protein n=1 Tax=Methylotenera sp. TaxID=2051956 RepID=UPI002488BE88|nr:DUF4124 domain-containing protein [Methylotenera sp.]MDI1300168.1 DUF4124 domain-containing protein [Methylotenera sp.]